MQILQNPKLWGILVMPSHGNMNKLNGWFQLVLFGFFAMLVSAVTNPCPFLREIIDLETIDTVQAWRVGISYFHMQMARHAAKQNCSRFAGVISHCCWEIFEGDRKIVIIIWIGCWCSFGNQKVRWFNQFGLDTAHLLPQLIAVCEIVTRQWQQAATLRVV